MIPRSAQLPFYAAPGELLPFLYFSWVSFCRSYIFMGEFLPFLYFHG